MRGLRMIDVLDHKQSAIVDSDTIGRENARLAAIRSIGCVLPDARETAGYREYVQYIGKQDAMAGRENAAVHYGSARLQSQYCLGYSEGVANRIALDRVLGR